jgi:hypothetical protein
MLEVVYVEDLPPATSLNLSEIDHEDWKRRLLPRPPAREPNENFKDCFGRPIAMGDVLAHGFRSGSNGGINVGIVYGFTEKTIQVYRVAELCHYEKNPEDRWSHKVVDGYRLVKGNIACSYNTFITGLTEQQLRNQLGIVSGTMGHEIEYFTEVIEPSDD